MMRTPAWSPINPEYAASLTDTRQQLHHAIQIAAAFGAAYLPAQTVESHTTLEWISADRTLASRAANGVRVAICIDPLNLVIGSDMLSLDCRTIANTVTWLRSRLANAGFDAEKYILAKPFGIPHHPVADEEPFAVRRKHLVQFSRWLGNAATILEELRASDSRATPVRLWPHKFDMSTTITVADNRTIDVALETGDDFCDEPYFCVTMSPAPQSSALPRVLRGRGKWHRDQWIGAVLTASRLSRKSESQPQQVREFLDSAIEASSQLVTQ